MTRKEYGVSVRIQVDQRTTLERFESVQGQDWNSALVRAQDITTRMFPEDPMAARLFRSGVLVYTNVNDLGDRVVISPTIRLYKDEVQVG